MSSRAVYEGSFARSVFIVAMSMSLSFVVAENSFRFKGQGDDRNLIVAEGVLSDIDFFLENSTSLGEQIQVIVQHQQGPHMAFNRKCQIIHRNEWPLDCQTQDPCLCGNFTSGTFEYKLRMVFSQADSGRWQFAIFNGTSVYITIRVMGVTENVTQQSSLESDSDFTAIIVISTLIVVLAISSTVVIWYCPMFVVRTTSDIIITIRRCLGKDEAIEYENPSDIATASIIDTNTSPLPPAPPLWQTAPDPAISTSTSPPLTTSPLIIGPTTPDPTIGPTASDPTIGPTTPDPTIGPTTPDPTIGPTTPDPTTSLPASPESLTSAPPASVTTASAPTTKPATPTTELTASITVETTTSAPETPVQTSSATASPTPTKSTATNLVLISSEPITPETATPLQTTPLSSLDPTAAATTKPAPTLPAQIISETTTPIQTTATSSPPPTAETKLVPTSPAPITPETTTPIQTTSASSLGPSAAATTKPTSPAPISGASSPSVRPSQQPPPPPQLQLIVEPLLKESAPASAPKAPEPATSPEHTTATTLTHPTPVPSTKESGQAGAPPPLVSEAMLTLKVSSRPPIPPKPTVKSLSPARLQHKGLAASSPKAPTPITPSPKPPPAIQHQNHPQPCDYLESSCSSTDT